MTVELAAICIFQGGSFNCVTSETPCGEDLVENGADLEKGGIRAEAIFCQDLIACRTRTAGR
jgi:hypothetical protein